LGCAARGVALFGDVCGAVGATVLDVAGDAAAGAALRVLGARGVFQQYKMNATHAAAMRIARPLCSASMDGGL
jgi:hypothetical protein